MLSLQQLPQSTEATREEDRSTEGQLCDERTNEPLQKGCLGQASQHAKPTRNDSSASKGGSKGFQAAACKHAAHTAAYPSSWSTHPPPFPRLRFMRQLCRACATAALTQSGLHVQQASTSLISEESSLQGCWLLSAHQSTPGNSLF